MNKSLQNVNADYHSQLKTIAARLGATFYIVTNSVIKSGLLINKRWDEFSPETKAELERHGIQPFK